MSKLEETKADENEERKSDLQVSDEMKKPINTKIPTTAVAKKAGQ